VVDAVEQLRRRGMFVTQIAPNRTANAAEAAQPKRVASAKLPLRVLALFTRQMAMLLKAGSGVVPAIQAVARQMKPQHAALLDKLVVDLEEGLTLTDALRRHPRTFEPVYCAIIAAGEASATLTQMFNRLSDMVGKQRALRNKLLGALAYPALLSVLCGKIILVLLFFVLPRFADMFKQLGVATPAVTGMLLSIGDTLRNYWPWLAAGLGLSVVGGVWMIRDARGRQWINEAVMRLPLIGRMRSRIMQAQILRTMGMLLEAQVGVLDTLELVRSSTWTKAFHRLFRSMDDAVTSGGQLSTAFSESGIIEPYICQAIRTGEDSGSLGEAMAYCADVLDETNTEMLNALAKLIEPAILITMGVVVGGVAISLFLPLFDLTSAIK